MKLNKKTRGLVLMLKAGIWVEKKFSKVTQTRLFGLLNNFGMKNFFFFKNSRNSQRGWPKEFFFSKKISPNLLKVIFTSFWKKKFFS